MHPRGHSWNSPTCANKNYCPSLWEFLHHLSAFATGGRLSWTHLPQAAEGRDAFSTAIPFRKTKEGAPHSRASLRDSVGMLATTPEPIGRAGPRGSRRTSPTGSGYGRCCWISLWTPCSVTFHNESNKLAFLSANQSELRIWPLSAVLCRQSSMERLGSGNSLHSTFAAIMASSSFTLNSSSWLQSRGTCRNHSLGPIC